MTPVVAFCARIETGNQIEIFTPPTGGTEGQCLTTDGNDPPTYSWSDCTGGAAASANFLLLEDTGFFLLENDAQKLRLEK
jgi:hypothetical protein